MKSILLIHPPVSKPCEPPAGLAKLARALGDHGVDCRVYDASIDGILGLLHLPLSANDTWTRRALSKRNTNLDALRSAGIYRNRDRYKRAVMDVNRLLHMAGLPYDAAISLSNFGSSRLSPVRSADLIRAAEQFEANPFHPIFSKNWLASFLMGTGSRRSVDQFHEPGPVRLCHDRLYPQAAAPRKDRLRRAGWSPPG
jgi:hypothetical protein